MAAWSDGDTQEETPVLLDCGGCSQVRPSFPKGRCGSELRLGGNVGASGWRREEYRRASRQGERTAGKIEPGRV